MQCLAALSTVYTVDWPFTFTAMLDVFSVINFDILSLTSTDCAFEQNFFDSLLLTLFLPVFAVVVLYYIYVHAFACKASRPKSRLVFKSQERRALTDRALRIFFWILLVSFPAASTKAMQHFKCIQLDEQVKWLDVDYRVRCGSASHFTHMLPAVLGILMYPIGVPLLLLCLVCQQRQHLNHPLVEERLGFLYSSYKKKYYYWEIVEIVRKLLLTSCIIFVGDGTSSQVLVGLLVSIVSLSLHLSLQPFAENTDDHIQTMSLSVLVLAHIAGLALKVNIATEDGYNKVVFDAVLVALPIVAFVAGLWLTVYESVLLPCRERKKNEASLRKALKKLTKITPIVDAGDGNDGDGGGDGESGAKEPEEKSISTKDTGDGDEKNTSVKTLRA